MARFQEQQRDACKNALMQIPGVKNAATLMVLLADRTGQIL
jgi:hypothetical protein